MSGTIFALSSGALPAGVGVVRISGPATADVLGAIMRKMPEPRYAALRALRDPATGEIIDRALVLWIPGPRSETGEDMAELHLHGGRAVVAAMLAVLGRFPGCRMAEAGEFARRSFANGKIDLVALEGLADLVASETETQRRQALAQTDGALGRHYEGWRGRLIEAMSATEAAIDFSDEPDVARASHAGAMDVAHTIAVEIDRHLDDGHRGEIVRDGFQVVIAGPPNAGKSSLLNALARRDVAIVSPEAGTTRDVLEVRLDLGGMAVVVADTAGLHEAGGVVEREGIRRAIERTRGADLVLWVTEAGGEAVAPPDELAAAGGAVLAVLNKCDLLAARDGAGKRPAGSTFPPPSRGEENQSVRVSALTGAGLDGLVAAIVKAAKATLRPSDEPLLTRARHREELERCRQALRDFLRGPADEAELRAEDLRRAAHALGRLTGRIDVEDVLDRLFAGFCIGK